MKITSIEHEQELIKFVQEVACALEDPTYHSYGTMNPGSYLAVRWGLDDDCVLVLKLDNSFTPVVYTAAISRDV